MATNNVKNANYPISGNYKPDVRGPFDSRTLVNTFNDLKDITTWQYTKDGETTPIMLYNGLTVTVLDTKKIYVLSNYTSTTSDTIGNWVWTEVSGGANYTQGENIKISGNTISAMGYHYDSAKNSFAIGNTTSAYGDSSYAEGDNTVASGNTSHAEGKNTITLYQAEHAEGMFNVSSSKTSSYIYDGIIYGDMDIWVMPSGEEGDEIGNTYEVYIENEYVGTFVVVGYDAKEGFYEVDSLYGTSWPTFNTENDGTYVKKFGVFNTIHSIGIGTSNNDRKNAVQVFTDGDVYIDRVGGYTGTTVESNMKSLQEVLGNKQNLLIAGDNIQISGDTISATDTTYDVATTGRTGLMSAADKIKLDNALTAYTDTNTWRSINVNGTQILGGGTNTGSFGLSAGTNVTLSVSGGRVTISATDTNTHYTAVPVLASSSSDIENSEGATSNSDTYLNIVENNSVSGSLQITGNGGATVSAKEGVLKINSSHRTISVNGTQVLGDNATPLNLKSGTNISITADGSGNVTITNTGGGGGGGGTSYVAGENIIINGNEISAKGYVYDENRNSFNVKNCNASGNYSFAEGKGSYAEMPIDIAIDSNNFLTFVNFYSSTALPFTYNNVSYTAKTGDLVVCYYPPYHKYHYDRIVGFYSNGGYAAFQLSNGIDPSYDYTQVSEMKLVLSGAFGEASHSEGSGTTASGDASHAEGGETIASGSTSHAEGLKTKALGIGSHAEGCVTGVTRQLIIANGNGSHAEGCVETTNEASGYIQSTGKGSHAEGYCYGGQRTLSSGNGSHAEGRGTTASGDASHAEGGGSYAFGELSHAEGRATMAYGKGSHAEGYWCVAGYTGLTAVSTTVKVVGITPGDTEYKVNTEPSFYFSSGETVVINSNDYTITDFNDTHRTITFSTSLSNDDYNWALNNPIKKYTTAYYGEYSHAEGRGTKTNGDYSHSEGHSTTSSGSYSHAEGYTTLAQNKAEHAEGSYNFSNKSSNTYGNSGNTQHSIGIGSTISRKNALEIMQNGDMYVYGMGGYDGTNISSALPLQSCFMNNLMPTGSIIMWAGITDQTETGIVEPIDGWLICNGASINGAYTSGSFVPSDIKYLNLCNVIGGKYGSGYNYRKLPDLRYRFPLGANNNHPEGEKGGASSVTLDVDQIPSHSHAINFLDGELTNNPTRIANSGAAHVTYTDGANVTAFQMERNISTSDVVNNVRSMYHYAKNNVHYDAEEVIANTGGGAAHNNMPPYLTFNFIIKYK